MSDVVMHLLSPDKALQDAKQALLAAEATLAGIGKKGLLERQVTHDKKVAEAQAAVESAKSRIIAAQAAVDAAKIGQAFKPQEGKKNSSVSDLKVNSESKPEKNFLTAEQAAAELVRKLKAEGAPQTVVRAAVEAHALEHYNALKASPDASPADIKIAQQNCSILKEDPLVFTQLEAAARNIRVLKIQGASAEKIQAAEAAYTTLEQGDNQSGAPTESSSSGSNSSTETISSSSTAVSEALQISSELAGSAQASSRAKTQSEPSSELAQTLKQSSDESAQSSKTQSESDSSSLKEAVERVRSLKAARAPQEEVKVAVDAYVTLVSSSKQSELKTPAVPIQAGPIQTAAEKVRALKAAKAPQAEVQAAIDAYVALAGTTSVPQDVLKTATPSNPVENAVERVRSLKAARAHPDEVKAAVDAYVNLMGAENRSAPTVTADRVRDLESNNASQDEVKSAIEAHNVVEAAEKVRILKTNKASQHAVKAAEEAYTALLNTTSTDSASQSQTSNQETKTHTAQSESQKEHKQSTNPDLEKAAEKVRSLKAAAASQAEVKAAVEAFLVEEARDKVRRLKATRSSQEVVKTAVEELRALLNPNTNCPPTNVTKSDSSQPTKEGGTVNMHLNESS